MYLPAVCTVSSSSALRLDINTDQWRDLGILTLIEVRHERTKLVGLLEYTAAHFLKLLKIAPDPFKQPLGCGDLASEESIERRCISWWRREGRG